MKSKEVTSYTFYDPNTFRIIVKKGDRISKPQEKILQRHKFLKIALSRPEFSEKPKQKTRKIRRRGWEWHNPGFPAQSIGRKKGCLAFASISSGPGNFTINGIQLAEYFKNKECIEIVLKPYEILGLSSKDYDITIEVAGSDPAHNQQPRAIAHAVAGVLSTLDAAYNPTLKDAGYKFRILR